MNQHTKISQIRNYYYQGRCDSSENLQPTLVDAFREIHHLLTYQHLNSISIDSLTDTEIQISWYPGPSHWVDFKTRTGCWVKAERISNIWQGSAEELKSLKEYLEHFTQDKPLSQPSWIPSFLILFGLCGFFSNRDKQTLAAFGIDEDFLRYLKKIDKPGRWLDIAAANSLWFENPEYSFPDLVKEML